MTIRQDDVPMTDQYPVTGEPEGGWQQGDAAVASSSDAAAPQVAPAPAAAAEAAPATAPDTHAAAGQAPAAWPTPSGWQAPQDNPYGAPSAPYGAAGHPGDQQGGHLGHPIAQQGGYAGYPTDPASSGAWQAQSPAHPGQQAHGYPDTGYAGAGYAGTGYAGTGYPGAADPAAGAGSWQYDTTVFPAAGAPPVSPAAAPSTSGSGGARPRTGLILVTAGLVGLLAGGLGAYAVTEMDSPSTSSSTVALPQVDADKSERGTGTVAAIAESVSPAVVSLEVSGAQGSGSGSGFVIRENGYIVTNNHVVEGAANGGEITVHFADGRKLDATIVGGDANYDIAVVKVDASGLPTAVLGNSDGVVVGDLAIAIGSPLGLDGTVTAGIVSALNRPVTAGGGGSTSFINAIQTDAAINPGNSGGALVNAAGEVIGVNSAIATLGVSGGQSGSIGLGFAIPINQVKRIGEELINTGTSTKPIIGVSLDSSYQGEGARVEEVTPGGPAEAAGLEAGDVIVGFDGQPVDDATSLIVDIRSKQPGDEVAISVRRGGSTQDLTITLGSDSSSG
jgi:putative serine protease PepD